MRRGGLLAPMQTIHPKLGKHERIVCAYAQPASGPGWANAPLWLIVRGEDGRLREECLQPEQQGKEVEQLYAVSAALHYALLSALAIQYSKAEAP